MISAKNKGVFGSVSLATSPEAPLPPVFLIDFRKPPALLVSTH